jgi:exodeoxyribonuclease VII large subunit
MSALEQLEDEMYGPRTIARPEMPTEIAKAIVQVMGKIKVLGREGELRPDLVADLMQKNARLVGALNRLAQEARLRLTRVERGIPDLPALLGAARQRLDDRAERAMLALPALVAKRRAELIAIERRLPDPHRLTARTQEAIRDRAMRLRLAAPGLVATRKTALEATSHRIATAVQRALGVYRGKADRILVRMSDAPLRATLREARAHLSGLGPRLDAASPLAILQRGYVLVTTPSGQPVTSAAKVKPNARLKLRFGDGEVEAVAQGGGKSRGATAQERLDL